MTEDELRDLLHGAAGRGGVALLDDDAAVDAVVETAGAQRRRRTVLIAVAACVALIAGAVPVLWPSGRTSPDPEVASAEAAVLDWPVRGSLADDAAALEAVRGLAWSDHPQGAPAVEERRVAFLGDVEGSRWALVVGRGDDGGAVTGQWFTGQEGADLDLLVPSPPVEWLEDVASAGHVPASGDVLVVLTAPGNTVELSPRVEVGADGSVAREFAPVETVDGLAVTDVDLATPYASSGLYRVVRDGAVVETRPVPVPLGSGHSDDPRVLTPLDPNGEAPDPDALYLAREGVLAETGLTREQVRLDLLFAGPLPGWPEAEGPDGVVLAVTLPNGAVVASVAWADSGAGTSRGCGMQAHPAGTPLDTLGIAVVCEIEFPESGPEPALLMYAPGGVARYTVTSPDGTGAEAGSAMGGFVATRPAPESGVLRLSPFDGGALEWAVFGRTPEEIVDRDGRGALD